MSKRTDRLMPNGIPRYVRCYKSKDDNIDPYTVVYTGNHQNREYRYMYVSMSENPTWPIGVCTHDYGNRCCIDALSYGHLGKKIKFQDLPLTCRLVVLNDYKDIWNLGE